MICVVDKFVLGFAKKIIPFKVENISKGSLGSINFTFCENSNYGQESFLDV